MEAEALSVPGSGAKLGKGALASHRAWLPTSSPFSPGSPGGPLGPSLPWRRERWGLSSQVWSPPPAPQPPVSREGTHRPPGRSDGSDHPLVASRTLQREHGGVSSSRPNLSPQAGPSPPARGSAQLPDAAKQPC